MALGSSFWKFRPTSAVFFSHLRLDRSSSWTICWPRYDLSILGGHIPPRRGQLERDFVKTNWTLQKKTCKLSRLEKGSLLFLVLIILQEGLVHIFWGESTRRPQCGSFPLKMNGWNLTCIFHAPAFCRWFQPNWKNMLVKVGIISPDFEVKIPTKILKKPPPRWLQDGLHEVNNPLIINGLLVGGWTNPFEKYGSKWVHLPQFSGWKFQKIFELPPPGLKIHGLGLVRLGFSYYFSSGGTHRV